MATLYMATYRRMISVVRRYVADDDRVRDIVHDGFIIVFTSLGKLREPSKLESWMAGVMRRLALKSEINARRYDMVGIDGQGVTMDYKDIQKGKDKRWKKRNSG